ncbi:hypothetical protein SSX86_004909 [Deinandra increscens subsp. villosa]|uniref:Reverse transcriptase Ty1/copia-type domain-containing protein n=1 Tax=Deinandra increscens subsp. villosa TaxID=3103831 RepID=A0AAP0HBD3_9ASTR
MEKEKKQDKGYKKSVQHNSDQEESEGYESSDMLVVDTIGNEESWIVDSGCSFHMTPNKAYFKSLKMEDKGTVWSVESKVLVRFNLILQMGQPFYLKMSGYPSGVKGFKLWRLEGDRQKVIISRDVTCREDVLYKDIVGESKVSKVQGSSSESRVQSEVELDHAKSSGPKEPINEMEITGSSDHNTPEQGTHVQHSPTSTPGHYDLESEVQSSPRNISNFQLARDRTRRTIIKPLRYRIQEDISAFSFATAEMESIHEPLSYEDAFRSDDKEEWRRAMVEEIESLKEYGGKHRFRARLVAKGYTQTAGIDYQEVFSSVVKHTSIRVMLSLVAVQDLELVQLDVKTAFLHGNLDDEIYIDQPKGFTEVGKEHCVCKLQRSLYGLKQSPRQCPECKVYLLLYVDDMLIAGKDIGIIGMEIERNMTNRILKLSQGSYIRKVLKSYGMEGCKPVKTSFAAHFKLSSKDSPVTDDEFKEMEKVPYAQVVGSLMFLMVCTRLDISFGVSVVSRFLSNPGKEHWKAVKWILRYLAGTKDKGIWFGDGKIGTDKILGFVDSDFAKDLDKFRSITGYVFLLFGNLVSWRATLQGVVALSSTEAEYMALTEAMKEALWLTGFIKELGVNVGETCVNYDKQGAIALSKNGVFYERIKHINVRYHFIREMINTKQLVVEYVNTNKNCADVFTKALPSSKFLDSLRSMGIG